MTVWEDRTIPILAQLNDLDDELACFHYLLACAGEQGWAFDEDLRQPCHRVAGWDSRM